jgi:Lar family restriction alleviation protein
VYSASNNTEAELMQTLHLEPCPFCGKRDLEIDDLGSEERPFFVVSCRSCEAEGPIARSSLAAVKHWNSRAERKGDGI